MAKDYFRIIGFMALVVVLITLFYVFMLPLFAGGMVVNRIATKYQTETSKQAYDTSRQYQQGTQLDISRYCRQMAEAPNAAAKQAVAGLIRDTAATYTGPLTPNNQACLASIGE